MAGQNRRFSSFMEFWPHYLSQHQNPINRRLHILGTVVSIAMLGLAVVHSWLWIFAATPLGYALAWTGHYFVEQNRPVTLDYPIWSLRADLRMTALTLLRRPLPKPQPETHGTATV